MQPQPRIAPRWYDPDDNDVDPLPDLPLDDATIALLCGYLTPLPPDGCDGGFCRIERQLGAAAGEP